MHNTSEAGNRRILIVDDNPAIHEDYKKILTSRADNAALDELTALVLGEARTETQLAQFELTSAFQGQEGRDLVQRSIDEGSPFAMAFVDMRMPPGWDGLETIQQLWMVDPHLQIVICTAYSDYTWSEIIQRVQHRDRLLILKKPFDNAEVCQLAIALTQKWELERQSQQKMRAIVETAADGIITFHEDGVIESCNGAACQLFGAPRNELIGANVAALLREAKESGWEEFVCRQFGVGESAVKEAIELTAERGDGTFVPLLFSLSEFTTESGRMFAAILRDLTEYKRLQRELAQSQKLESIGQLAAGVSHEINTPMQFIGDNVEYLNECLEKLFAVVDAYEENLQPDSPARSWNERAKLVADVKQQTQFGAIRSEMLQAVGESLDGVRRVIQIVRAMKEFSHLGSDQKLPTDLNEAIRSTVTITRNRWKYVADMVTDFAEDLPDAPCMPAEINQVLLNLVVNAADAIAAKCGDDPSEKGKITIRTRSEEGQVIVAVEDTGCGIPDDVIHRVFDPFFTTKEVGKGTGQGLTICHDVVVNKHQGTIEIATTPGEGSTFTIRLPLAAPAKVASEPADLIGV